jgi:hypothetical protein
MERQDYLVLEEMKNLEYARASLDTMAMDIRQSHILLVNLDFFSLPAAHF